MKQLPLAPMPGGGMETFVLEKAPPPEPDEAEAIARAWADVPAGERRGRRDLLLPALIELQQTRGWISYPALASICLQLMVPLADAYGVASFYGLLSTEPGPRKMVYVCDDIACRLRGAEQLTERLTELLGPPKEFGNVGGAGGPTGSSTPSDDELPVGWAVSPCLGQCDRAPAAFIDGKNVGYLTPVSLAERVDGIAEAADNPPSHVGHYGAATPLLLRRAVEGGGNSLAAYVDGEGYSGLRRALEIGPEETIEEVRRSRLVGRGGAAFPAAMKWSAVAEEDGPRYVVCNADESEPGTFKDRILLEQDPFSVIEGMTIAGWAVGAERGYLYLRGEYLEARTVIERALEQAELEGYLGDDILGTDFSFHIELRLGAGAYVCGEETALFNSLEGYRGEPRAKPPFPTQVGLFGRPTVINNVETLACVPPIVERGGAAFAEIGTEQSTGTKLVSISGHVAEPGVYEVPFGVSLRTIIDELAGGVPGGRSVQAVLCGGAAGTFLTPDELDEPLAFETLRAIGGTVGSGAIVVYDETADLWDAVERIAQFFMDESCGQCVPCRVGTRRQWEWVRVERRRTANGEVTTANGVGERDDLLNDLAVVMQDSSICGLGQLAPNALLSGLRLLRGEGR